tara:strand:- start:5214 stop:6086 length:873 start_codon:yes stop_codon:yes gene_type:complete
MGQNTKTKFIKLSKHNIDLHYMTSGKKSNKTFVLVHGLGSYSKAFLKNIDQLANHAKVYAIDLPGFGKTELRNFVPSMNNYAQLMNEFVIKKRLTNVVLVGHSMGGQIVTTIAINEAPEWLDSIVLLSPAGIETFTSSDLAWFNNVITEALYLNLTDEQIKNNFSINFNDGQLPKDAVFMLEDRMLIKEDQMKYQQYCSHIVNCINAMLNEPIYHDISNINVPIKMFFGKEDLLIPNKILHPKLSLEDLVNKLKKDYPNVVVEIVENAGHFVQWDRNDIINKSLIRDLNN